MCYLLSLWCQGGHWALSFGRSNQFAINIVSPLVVKLCRCVQEDDVVAKKLRMQMNLTSGFTALNADVAINIAKKDTIMY